MNKTHQTKGKPYKIPKSATFTPGRKNPHLTHSAGSKKSK